MSFSQFAGTAIVPTLARLVLAAAFVAAGWGKVFTESEFSAEEGARLRALGVSTTPVVASITPAGPNRGAAPAFIAASLRQTTAPETQVETPAETQPDAKPATPSTQPVSTSIVLPGKHRASTMHKITLMVDQQQWPAPVWMARLAAFTELIGSVLILVGLFARLWGLGLACVMGVAFYMVSLPVILDKGLFGLSTAEFNTLYCQLGLFVLAFGVLLTGPGPLSLDRLLFGRREPEAAEPPREPIRLPG
jgi:uncharacterized membrane protein YphA (DoxX/SURF4 family)